MEECTSRDAKSAATREDAWSLRNRKYNILQQIEIEKKRNAWLKSYY